MMKTHARLLRSLLLLGLIVLACLQGYAPPARAASTTRYVSPGGIDGGDCTAPVTPCATLQYAIDQSTAGDELHLAAGAYTGVQTLNGHSQIAWVDKTLGIYGGFDTTFTSRDADTNPTILDAAGGGRIVFASGAISLTLDGLQMINGSTQNDPSGTNPGGGVYSTGADLTLRDSQIKDCRTTYGDGSGLYLELGSLEMDDSVVQDNSPLLGDSGSHYGGGLYLTQSKVEINNSRILNNTASLAGYIGGGSGGGVYLDRSDAVIQATTIHGNQAATVATGNGGGLATSQGSLQLLDSTLDGNTATASDYEPGYGGGLDLRTANAVLRGNTFSNNVTGNSPNNNGSAGGAILIGSYWGTVLTGNRFEDNTCYDCSGGAVSAAGFGGLQFTGNQFIGNQAGRDGGALLLTGPSTASSLVTLRDNLLQGNQAGGSGGAIYYYGTIDLLFNQFIGNHANSGGGVYQNEGSRNEVGNAVDDGNLFSGNSANQKGGGLYIGTTFSDNLITAYQNMAFLDNQAGGNGGAIYFSRYTRALTTFSHLTFSGNTAGDNSTFYDQQGKPLLRNSLITNALVGINDGWYLGLDHVLFDQVTTPVEKGSPNEPPPDPNIIVSGIAALDADGYHLTAASAAIDAGVDAGVIDDIDGQPRPLGAAPDLGADESPYTLAHAGMQAWLLTGQPTWKMAYTGPGAPPSTYFSQDYVIPFANYTAGLTAPAYNLQFQLPDALNLTSATTQPTMTDSSSGNALKWTSQAALLPDQWGWVELEGQSSTVPSGTVLDSSGQMEYSLSNSSNGQIPFTSSITVPPRPIFSPLLLTPFDGEMCLDDDHQLTASGLAGGGSIVRLYENNSLMGSVAPDSQGKYSITWTSAMSDTNPVEIHTVACESGGGECSSPSKSVHLVYPHGNWCPQRSYWEGDVGGTHYEFHFKNDGGNYATNDFLIPGVYYFNNTLLHLYSCCKGDVNPFRVMADGKAYTTPSAHSGHWFTFNIQSAHDVQIYSNCAGEGSPSGHSTISYGKVLIDPDGFVFDQMQGAGYDTTTGMFTPVQPLAGVTVTAYYWAEDWGTWIPWPAQFYDNQVNPQVTGSSGYFAFFTPPGKYYLQFMGKAGFQSWRSPVIVVTSQVVHMNAPLTSAGQAGPVQVVKVSPSGLNQPEVVIQPGGSVEWQASADTFSSADTIEEMLTSPVQRLISLLDPLINPLGFDSGMLAPGGVYRRKFDQTGTYTYNDGYGHTGKVTVIPAGGIPIYLPIILK